MEGTLIFTDKKDRKTKIIEDFNIHASHNGRRVGCIEFGEREYDYKCGMPNRVFLYGMNVEDKFQRAGIAFAMMKCAVEIHGKDFDKPNFNSVGGRDAASDAYYTDEGRAFISYCIHKGLLEDTDWDDGEYELEE
jgi:hypothetical protein